MPRSQIPRYGILQDISSTLLGLAKQWHAEDSDGEEIQGLPDRRPNETSLLSKAEQLYRSRRGREKMFPASFFGEPAWDMLLELFVADGKGQEISVKSICIASAAPVSTGLRWLTVLEQEGLVTRTAQPNDGRVSLVFLTPKGRQLVTTYIDQYGA